MKQTKLTVIDFFSGAGGFSEGFRQQGFNVIKGVDFWEPAVRTHNLNHGLADNVENVLDYMGIDSNDVVRIEELPDVDVIIGSPSCVTFSMSNKGGKADKTEGLKLITAYLRVIAVKKHKRDSRLKAWLMENVPNSGNYVSHDYNFYDLNLEGWARKNGINPQDSALSLNGTVLNASDYGAPQNRSRFICGEIVESGEFPMPMAISKHRLLLADIKSKMPNPSSSRPTGEWEDPNYPGLFVNAEQISDHFYDTGLYVIQWEQARSLKIMHPYMGRMSFPEAEDKSARTITATLSISSRESHIYKSEYNREGNGEFRTPTIREAASLMGYPYTYQFFGSEGIKWKLIGNSVSPQLSSALAAQILRSQGRKPIMLKRVNFETQKDLYLKVDNLNTYEPKEFSEQKHRRPTAKFRRCFHKSQNMTVDLLNYNPQSSADIGGGWYVGVFYGTGTGHKYNVINRGQYRRLTSALEAYLPLFDEFLMELKGLADWSTITPSSLQYAYTNDSSLTDSKNPLVIGAQLKAIADKYAATSPGLSLPLQGLEKPSYPLGLLLCLFSLGFVVYNDPIQETNVAIEQALAFEI